MQHPRTIIAGIGLAVMAAGGVTAVSAGGSPASSAPSAGTAAATVRAAPAAVGRSTGTILVNAQAAAASTPGSLDPTFGNGGKVLTDLGAIGGSAGPHSGGWKIHGRDGSPVLFRRAPYSGSPVETLVCPC
jgi:hypothetical protein